MASNFSPIIMIIKNLTRTFGHTLFTWAHEHTHACNTHSHSNLGLLETAQQNGPALGLWLLWFLYLQAYKWCELPCQSVTRNMEINFQSFFLCFVCLLLFFCCCLGLFFFLHDGLRHGNECWLIYICFQMIERKTHPNDRVSTLNNSRFGQTQVQVTHKFHLLLSSCSIVVIIERREWSACLC